MTSTAAGRACSIEKKQERKAVQKLEHVLLPSVDTDVGVVHINDVAAAEEGHVGVLSICVGERGGSDDGGAGQARQKIAARHTISLHLHARRGRLGTQGRGSRGRKGRGRANKREDSGLAQHSDRVWSGKSQPDAFCEGLHETRMDPTTRNQLV